MQILFLRAGSPALTATIPESPRAIPALPITPALAHVAGAMTTANKITIGRIVMIPFFVLMALYYGRSVAHGHPQEWMRLTAIAIFVVAAASDGIDGYIARRYNQMSKLGTVLDPIADKGLLLAGVITLSVSNWQYEFPLWFPVLVIARDVAIVTGVIAVHFINGDTRVSPSWMGKTATVAQMIAIGCAMLFTGSEWKGYLDVPVFVAGFFTLVSGLLYIREGIRQLHAKGHGEPQPPGRLL